MWPIREVLAVQLHGHRRSIESPESIDNMEGADEQNDLDDDVDDDSSDDGGNQVLLEEDEEEIEEDDVINESSTSAAVSTELNAAGMEYLQRRREINRKSARKTRKLLKEREQTVRKV